MTRDRLLRLSAVAALIVLAFVGMQLTTGSVPAASAQSTSTEPHCEIEVEKKGPHEVGLGDEFFWEIKISGGCEEECADVVGGATTSTECICVTTNDGCPVGSSVWLSDEVPDGFKIKDVWSSDGHCVIKWEHNKVWCFIRDFDGYATIKIKVEAKECGEFTNRVHVKIFQHRLAADALDIESASLRQPDAHDSDYHRVKVECKNSIKVIKQATEGSGNFDFHIEKVTGGFSNNFDLSDN